MTGPIIRCSLVPDAPAQTTSLKATTSLETRLREQPSNCHLPPPAINSGTILQAEEQFSGSKPPQPHRRTTPIATAATPTDKVLCPPLASYKSCDRKFVSCLAQIRGHPQRPVFGSLCLRSFSFTPLPDQGLCRYLRVWTQQTSSPQRSPKTF